MIRTLHELSHLIFTSTLGSWDYYYAHFLGAETEAWKGCGTCPGSKGKYVLQLGYESQPDPETWAYTHPHTMPPLRQLIVLALFCAVLNWMHPSGPIQVNLGHETSPKQPRPLYSFLPLSPADNHIHPFLQSQWCLLCIMYCANLKTCCALWQFLYIYRKGGNCGL